MSLPVAPTPPAGKRPKSASQRVLNRNLLRSGSSSSQSSHSGSPQPISRQNSLLSPVTNEICYEYLPDVTKPATTIGRYHTIVPPISARNARPASRSDTVMTEENVIVDEFSTINYRLASDDHAIHSVTEENDPDTPRLLNPTARVNTVENDLKDSSLSSDLSPPMVHLAIKLPSGERLVSQFSAQNTLQTVLDWVSKKTGDNFNGWRFRLVGERYSDLSLSIKDCNILDHTALYLESPD